KRGHVVELAENGADAVALASTRHYDAILMDMHMPVMDGASATVAIRALDGPAARIPIIALTAGLTDSQRATYIAAGVDEIVAKPAHWPSLFATLEGMGHAFHGARQIAAPDTPLDAAAVDALQATIGTDTVSKLLVSFRQSVDGYDREIRQALSDQDLIAAKRAAHGLKGSCLQFGAIELGRIAAAMEKPDTTLADIQGAIVKIAPAVARLDAALAARAA
ncbi:MAG: response regulator, partial [Reyranella sp.]